MAGLLAKQGHKVLVLEREAMPRFHIGESLLPSCLPVLERLGVGPCDDGYVFKRGAEFVCEATGRNRPFDFAEALPGPPRHAWQVERSVFDAQLSARASELGAEPRQATVTRVELGADAVVVHTKDGRERGRFVVDATGQNRLLARQLGAAKPIDGFGRTAAFVHYEGLSDAAMAEVSDGHEVRILVRDDGWGWLIPLPGRRLSVGLVLRGDAPAAASFEAFLAGSKLIQRWTAGASRSEIRRDRNFSFVNTRSAGSRFVCVGDSACFLDPVLSSGVSFALVGAEHAADALSPALAAGTEGDPDLMAHHTAKMDEAYALVASLIDRFYNTRFVEHFIFAAEYQEQTKREPGEPACGRCLAAGQSLWAEPPHVSPRHPLHRMPYVTPRPITGYSVCNALGLDREEMLASLLESRSGLGEPPLPLPFPTFAGPLPGELPDVPGELTDWGESAGPDRQPPRRAAAGAADEGAGTLVSGSDRGGPRHEHGGGGLHREGLPALPVHGRAAPGLLLLQAAHVRRAGRGRAEADRRHRPIVGGVHHLHVQREAARVGLADDRARHRRCRHRGRHRHAVHDDADRLPLAGGPVADPVPAVLRRAQGDQHRRGRGVDPRRARGRGPGPPRSGGGELGRLSHQRPAPRRPRRGRWRCSARSRWPACSRATSNHINAHGTGTALNDLAEGKAIQAVFGGETPVVSTKCYTGHTLGGAGAIEAVASMLVLEEGFIPAALDCDPVDPKIDINVVSELTRGSVRRVLSNSFAFGGNNVSVLLRAA